MNSQAGTVLVGLSTNIEITVRTDEKHIGELHQATKEEGLSILKKLVPASHMKFTVAGSSVNLARALMKAEHSDVKLLGTVGDDHWGNFILQALTQQGVDYTPLLSRNSTNVTTNVVTTGEKPALLSINVKGPYQHLMLPQIADRVHAEVIRIRPTYRVATGVQDADAQIIEAMFRSANANDGTEINSTKIINLGASLVEPSRKGGSFEQERIRWLVKILKLADILALNYGESSLLLASLNISSMQELRTRVQNPNLEILVTRGPDGLSYHRPNEQKIQLKAFPAPRVIDTTGAGDCLLGHFVARRIAGDDLETALTFGLAASALSVGKLGGDCSPSLNDTLGFVQQMKGR